MFIVDSNVFRAFGNYYPEAFPTFWEQFDAAVGNADVGSVREVRKEIELQDFSEHVGIWVANNSSVFPSPTEDEMAAVAEIFAIEHFQQLIGERQRLRGQPVADPFLVARAKCIGGCVVTQEALKPNAAKIPNVCAHFGVDCTDLQGFLRRVGWRY
ncbi:MAG: PIN domain-containing protein [Gemmatimonadaceae bacterium]